jgi:glycosyltransferase involved in cell wall biosynthesis
MGPPMTAVALCICTYRRPTRLRMLLDAVAGLDFAGPLEVIVVDNDPAGEGLAVCDDLVRGYRWPLRSALEPERGISHARNRAIRTALAGRPDFVAMLDDDEWPAAGWLRHLLEVQARTGADVVGGPVVPTFPPDAHDWSRLPEYYGVVPRLADGAPCVLFAAGNVLVRATCFRALSSRPFDPELGLSGGEDLAFFGALDRLGFRMAWAAHAVVYEPVDRSRLSLAWLKRRQQRHGILNVVVQRKLAPGGFHEVVRLAKTAVVLSRGGAWYLWSCLFRRARLRAVLFLHYGLGKVSGHVGRQRQDYA